MSWLIFKKLGLFWNFFIKSASCWISLICEKIFKNRSKIYRWNRIITIHKCKNPEQNSWQPFWSFVKTKQTQKKLRNLKKHFKVWDFSSSTANWNWFYSHFKAFQENNTMAFESDFDMTTRFADGKFSCLFF